jgi:hypothetical protein
MSSLWSPVVATGGNRSQIAQAREPPNQAKTVAVGCDRLRATFHGKEGVSGSSPEEGSLRRPCKSAPFFPAPLAELPTCARYGALT